MIPAVGSTNEAKVSAVREVIRESTHLSLSEIVSVATQSGVSDQPLSLQRTIWGGSKKLLSF